MSATRAPSSALSTCRRAAFSCIALTSFLFLSARSARSAAAAEAAEACLGNVLDDVAGVPAPLPAPLDDGKAAEDDDVALAAAAAAAAVQAADGMAVVVDQAVSVTQFFFDFSFWGGH